MNNKHNLPTRKQIRLTNYNYALPGRYYITICTQNRKCIFGNIFGGKIVLNNVGKIIYNIWKSLPDHHNVELNTFQLMPNHVHFVIQIVGATRGSPAGGSRPAPTTGLGTIIGLFKSECTKQIRRTLKKPNLIIWQPNYYEHIIRNDNDLNKIRKYIQNNPKMWDRDRNNPNQHEI